MSKLLREPDIYVCLLWHPSQNTILRSQLQPSRDVAQMVAHRWGKHATYVKAVKENIKFTTRKNLFALVYGKHMNVKVKLFKEESQAMEMLPIVSREPCVDFVCGFQF